MSLSGAKEEVRDGYLGDLPEDLRIKVMDIHKMVAEYANSEFGKKKYDYLNNQQWAKSMLEEFLTIPKDKSEVGSVRIFKKGKRFKCMIQLTAHVTNNRNTEDEEFFHGFLRNVHTGIRGKIRRKYDVTLICESEHGEHFEGFDIWTKQKVAKELWEHFSDKKSKVVKPMKESVEDGSKESTVLTADLEELPEHLQELVESMNEYLCEAFNHYVSAYEPLKESSIFETILETASGNTEDAVDVGFTIIEKCNDGSFTGSIIVTPEPVFETKDLHLHEDVEDAISNLYADILEEVADEFYNDNPTKQLVVSGNVPHQYFEFKLTSPYAEKLWEYLENTDTLTEASHGKLKFHFRKAFDWDTGHSVKIVYELNPGNIVDVGKGALDQSPDKETAIADIRKNIRRKGNNDHVSAGDKVLAIVDRVTGKNLKKCRCIGPFNPQIPSSMISINDDELERLHEYYKSHSYEDRIKTIEVGKVDPSATYKATHWFNNDKGIKKLRNGQEIEVDKTIARGTTLEGLKYGRGAKLNDIIDPVVAIVGRKPVYAHPSKKDIRDNPKAYGKESFEDYIEWDPFTESENPEYDTDMSVNQAKRTLHNLTANIISDKKKPMSQYNADIYSNIITKNLLSTWAKGYQKFRITLDSSKPNLTLEFKVPKITEDFISRFIEGRENINGMLHRTPEITVKMSPNIFTTMKDADDAFYFFRALVRYYDNGIEVYSRQLMNEVMKLDRGTKHLISNGKLAGLVTLPMQMLFVFDDVHMNNKETFKISKSDINTINHFIRAIPTKYAAPEKEKKQILDDFKEVIGKLRDSSAMGENVSTISTLLDSATKYLEGGFDTEMSSVKEKFYSEYTDRDWPRSAKDPQVRYLQEKFGVKKLKKIPTDLVAYITIEAECIKDANDKMMIASYCLSKIEIVEWYIELLEVGSKKYIVPHSKPYLESVRTQLLACYKKIMDTPIPKQSDRPIIDIKYPKGYEG